METVAFLLSGEETEAQRTEVTWEVANMIFEKSGRFEMYRFPHLALLPSMESGRKWGLETMRFANIQQERLRSTQNP